MIFTWREKTGREVRSRPRPAQSKTKEKGRCWVERRYTGIYDKQIDARLIIYDLHIAGVTSMYRSIKYNDG